MQAGLHRRGLRGLALLALVRQLPHVRGFALGAVRRPAFGVEVGLALGVRWELPQQVQMLHVQV